MNMNNKLSISQRGIEMPESPIRKLAPLAYQAEDRGIKIYRLNIGQPDLPTPQKALDSLKRIDRKTLEYSPSQGYKSLRKALVGYYERYQIKLKPDEIIITAGGSEAVLFAFMSCLNPGDEIIVPEPAYANYVSFAISAGAVIRAVTTTIEAEASIEGTEQYSRDVYDEYVERRKCLIDGVNRIPGCYTPMPMGAFYTVAKLPVDDAEKFCAWCLSEFKYKDEFTPEGYEAETVMMAPAAGFYSNPVLGKNQVRLAYVLRKEELQRALMILEKAIETYNSVE